MSELDLKLTEVMYEQILYPNAKPDLRVVRAWKKHNKEKMIINMGKIIGVLIVSVLLYGMI